MPVQQTKKKVKFSPRKNYRHFPPVILFFAAKQTSERTNKYFRKKVSSFGILQVHEYDPSKFHKQASQKAVFTESVLDLTRSRNKSSKARYQQMSLPTNQTPQNETAKHENNEERGRKIKRAPG